MVRFGFKITNEQFILGGIGIADVENVKKTKFEFKAEY